MNIKSVELRESKCAHSEDRPVTAFLVNKINVKLGY